MSTNKKLIAVDLDGTLFAPNHQLSTRTIDVMHSVVDRGHSMVVVTGRSSHSAILKIRKKIPEAVPTACFGWERVEGITYDAEFIKQAGGEHTLEGGGLGDDLGMRDIFKLYVRSTAITTDDLYPILKDNFSAQVEITSSGAPFIEVMALGVNKASGLARVASELGFAAEHVIAFGDSFNDLPMLQWAGEGVAMANANENVKSIANSHALSNADDGVAEFLARRLDAEEI